ncbi:MAG: GNAT family N-acetyltransferase [Acidimicrobiales bacterium]
MGDALVDEVVRWAGEQHADAVALWVTSGNGAAERLYACHGFVRTGATQPLPSNPAVDEIAMRLSLSGPGSSAPGAA